MLYLEKHYLFNSRRDLISKSNGYKNINNISFINSINLEFINLKHKSICIIGLCFFYLFLGLKGNYGSYSRSNLKKTLYCSLNLNNNKDKFFFLEKFIFINFYNELINNKLKIKSLSNVGTFSFIINDLYKFLELDENLFRFRKLDKLKISFNFNIKNKKTILILLKSLGFSF
jgi:hypothetical protein